MSESLTLPPNPQIVLLHDAEHADHYLPVQKARIEPPYTVRGFTDYLIGPAPENSGLHGAVTKADMLFVHRELITPKTADAHLALCSLPLIAASGYKTRTYFYDDDYGVEYIHPSGLREINQHGWEPRERPGIT